MVTETLSPQQVALLLPDATKITICLSRSPRWKATERKIDASVDTLEDSVAYRDSPIFKARAKALLAQLQADANKRVVRCKFGKLRMWPFEIQMPND